MQKKKEKEKKHAYDNENTKRIDITRECSISPSLRTDQVHHQVQIPSWVSKLIKNPEKPMRKFPDLVSQSAKPSKRLQSYVFGF